MAKRRNRKKGNKPSSSAPVVVLQTQQSPVTRPPRNRQRKTGGSKSQANKVLTFSLSMVSHDITGDEKGAIVFGPNATMSAAMVGMIKSFQHYRVTALSAQFVSAAASTDRGLMAIHVDTDVDVVTEISNQDSFPLRQGGRRSYSASALGDQPWSESSEDQFQFRYRCSGAAGVVVGFLKFQCTLQLQNPL